MNSCKNIEMIKRNVIIQKKTLSNFESSLKDINFKSFHSLWCKFKEKIWSIYFIFIGTQISLLQFEQKQILTLNSFGINRTKTIKFSSYVKNRTLLNAPCMHVYIMTVCNRCASYFQIVISNEMLILIEITLVEHRL